MEPFLPFIDSLWEEHRSGEEMKFGFALQSPSSIALFRMIAAYSHPFEGSATLALFGNEAMYEDTLSSLFTAKRMELIRFSSGRMERKEVEGARIYVECKDGIIPTSMVKSLSALHPASIYLFGKNMTPVDALSGKSPVISRSTRQDDAETKAYLDLIGCPLSRFALPKTFAEPEFASDWHYLGPARDYRAYDAIKEDIERALRGNDPVLFEEESFPVLRAALFGEEVHGLDLYRAIRRNYGQTNLFTRMAAYQHDTWILRTLCFHPAPLTKLDLLVPYRELVRNELEKLNGLDEKTAFREDGLYSDFLIPLRYLKSLID